MYNVLIADDNNLTRKSIILTIDWASLDCKVVAESDNGIDALSLAKKHIPDIIITDIRMPGIDGLEFTENVKTLFPMVKVIIITGYNEFSYAQKALKLGAFDLILKPIDNEELFKVIKRAVSALDENKKEQNEKEYLKNTIESNKDQVIAKLMIDSIAGLKISEANKFIQTRKKFFLFTAKYKLNSSENDNCSPDCSLEASKQSAEALKTKFPFEFIYFWLNDKFTVIVSEDNKYSLNKINDYILKICNYFVERNPLLNTYDYTIGISRIHSNYDEIKSAYIESLDAIDYRFFFPNKKIVTIDLIKNNYILSENTIMKKIYESLKSNELEKIFKVLDEVNIILHSEPSSVMAVKNLLSNICIVFFDYFSDDKIIQLNNLKSHTQISNDINEIDNLDCAILYIKNYIEGLVKNSESTSKENYSKVTLHVINYLYDNFDKKISLQEIADYASITPTHLCRVIKKDTGESFVDLFNKIKIGMAEKLLKESNLKVYEVANRVGIDNYSYFNKLFKKFTGTAPTKYYKKST